MKYSDLKVANSIPYKEGRRSRTIVDEIQELTREHFNKLASELGKNKRHGNLFSFICINAPRAAIKQLDDWTAKDWNGVNLLYIRSGGHITSEYVVIKQAKSSNTISIDKKLTEIDVSVVR